MTVVTEKKCVVFLGYTPNNAASIAALLDRFESCARYCFLSADRKTLAYRDQVKWLGIDSAGIVGKLISFFVASIQLRLILKKYDQVDICLPHPDQLVGNFLFFHPGVTHRFIFEDGLLNYHDAKPGPALVGRMKRRKRFGWLLGLPYRYYDGFISGIDTKAYDGAFLAFPDQAVRPERLGEIHTIRRYQPCGVEISTEDVVLFLDQDIESIIGERAASAIRASLRRFLNDLGLRIIYKPHYDMHVDKNLCEKWEKLDDEQVGRPAEEIIPIIRPRMVVSFVSSALVNIKLMHPEIDCLSYGGNCFPITISGKTMSALELLANLGVRTVQYADEQTV